MIAVTVDGPLGEDDIGGFRAERTAERFIVSVVDDGASIDLTRERCARLQDLASFLGLRGADTGAEIKARPTAEAFAAIQVEKNYLVAEIGVARDGSGAAALRISRMATGDDDFEGADGGLGE